MEIKITDFFNGECPSDYSASRAEIGQSAGADTWSAAKECEFNYVSDDTREALRNHFKEFGAWDEKEINSWDDIELNALFIQDVSAAMRDFIGFGENVNNWNWDAYEQLDNAGRLFKGIDSEVYFYVGN